jgi:hypothetical protein
LSYFFKETENAELTQPISVDKLALEVQGAFLTASNLNEFVIELHTAQEGQISSNGMRGVIFTLIDHNDIGEDKIHTLFSYALGKRLDYDYDQGVTVKNQSRITKICGGKKTIKPFTITGHYTLEHQGFA